MMPGTESRWLLAVCLWLVLSLPPLRAGLEATLIGHMLVQIGLLAIVGWWLGRTTERYWYDRVAGWNRYGATGLVAAIFCLLFWMLPRNLDAALQSAAWESAKFISVPLLLGMPLAVSWHRLPVVARAVVWAQILPMLVVLGWVYRQAPVQLCNNYLLDQQVLLGTGMWMLAVSLAVYFLVRMLAGAGSRRMSATDSGAGARPRCGNVLRTSR